MELALSGGVKSELQTVQWCPISSLSSEGLNPILGQRGAVHKVETAASFGHVSLCRNYQEGKEEGGDTQGIK